MNSQYKLTKNNSYKPMNLIVNTFTCVEFFQGKNGYLISQLMLIIKM